jgi:gamma-D-glutamyl-L-lysine dipeptidyl-peptidase
MRLALIFTPLQRFIFFMSYAICTVAAAPLRKEPSHRSEMTSQLLFGDMLEELEEKEEWVRVRCMYDGYEGWTTFQLITALEEPIATAPQPFVTSTILNPIRLGTDIFQIPMGCTLPGFNATTQLLWNESFTYEGAVRNTHEAYTKELFQALIKPWLHAPYLWGGKTVLGVDCSGFVQTVFKVLGVPLLRDAYQQVKQGIAVANVAAAREGDLAFFNNEAGRITHVGIVLNGGKIIHASGMVRIDTLTESGIFTTAKNKQTHHLHAIRRVANFES